MLLCLAFISLLHSKEDFYSEEVLSLYLDKGTKAVGRLLPTNPFQILKQEGDWVKIRISGYNNPQAPFAVYFNDSQRIMVAAFSKNTPLHFTQRIAGKGGPCEASCFSCIFANSASIFAIRIAFISPIG